MRRSRKGGKSGAPPAPYSWKIQTISFEVTENSQIGMENKNFPQTPPPQPSPVKTFLISIDLRMTYIWMRSTSSKVMHYDIITTIHYQWVSKLHNVRLPTKYSLTSPNFSATIVSTALSVRTQNRGGGFLLIKKRGMMSVRSLKRYKIWQAHSSIVTLPFSFRNFQ